MDNARRRLARCVRHATAWMATARSPRTRSLPASIPTISRRRCATYKSGARKNPVMGAMASTLTAKDINDLAAYYGSQPAVLISRY